MTNERETENCPACDGMGTTADFEYLRRLVSLILLAGSDGVRKDGKGRHPYFDDLDRLIGMPKGNPTPALGLLTGGLAGRAPDRIFGHDGLDEHHAVRIIVQAAGMPEDWGNCPACKGEGLVPKVPSPPVAGA
jgi:hypothetical protein